MIVSMLDIDKTQESILVVVIEKDNLERMENADPITLESIHRGGMMPVPKYPQAFSMLIACEKDEVELYRRVREEGAVELFAWLERGRTWVEGVDGKGNSFVIRKGIKTWAR